MNRFDGKVAFITGAARGQGHSHALRLASEGADIIACDICEQMDSVKYPLATPEDLAETVNQVKALGRRIVARKGDVRDYDRMREVVAEGVSELGKIDVIVANAGISAASLDEESPRIAFEDTVAVNLTGVWNSVHAAVPPMIEADAGGSVILISSTQGLTGTGAQGHGFYDGYAAAKHGLVGLMRTWAFWLSKHNIRVNSIHPTGVHTKMIDNEISQGFLEQASDNQALSNLLDIDALQPEDISAAVAFVASDEAKYVTGVTLPVDAGFLVK